MSIRIATRIASAAATILLIISCGESQSDNAPADRERIAQDAMERMSQLEREAPDADSSVILTGLGNEPDSVRSVLLEGRWITPETAQGLQTRLPFEIASELTPTEADRLAASLRDRGGSVEIARNPADQNSGSESSGTSPTENRDG